jgi:hypothetical protein
MYDLGLVDREALAALGNASERMVVQRWVELTFDHSHPEWRLSGRSPAEPDPEVRLLRDLAESKTDRLFHTVAEVAADVLLAGGTHSWQFQAVRSHLLKGADRAGRSFSERLRDLCPSSWDEKPPEAGESKVFWRAESSLPKNARFAGAGKTVPSGGGWAGDAAVAAETYLRDGRRLFVLSTRTATRDPRASSVAQLRDCSSRERSKTEMASCAMPLQARTPANPGVVFVLRTVLPE